MKGAADHSVDGNRPVYGDVAADDAVHERDRTRLDLEMAGNHAPDDELGAGANGRVADQHSHQFRTLITVETAFVVQAGHRPLDRLERKPLKNAGSFHRCDTSKSSA